MKTCACGCGAEVTGTWKQGHNPKTKGRKFSDEHKARLSESNRGKNAGERHPNFGKHLSEETRKKIADAHRGKPLSLERRQQISAAKLAKGVSTKPGAIHKWLRHWYPLTGVCETCGATGRTSYASLTQHIYTRNRLDYAELCSSCHLKLDYGSEQRPSQAGKPKPRRRR